MLDVIFNCPTEMLNIRSSMINAHCDCADVECHMFDAQASMLKKLLNSKHPENKLPSSTEDV